MHIFFKEENRLKVKCDHHIQNFSFLVEPGEIALKSFEKRRRSFEIVKAMRIILQEEEH